VPGLPYISGVIEGFTDPYDAVTNPNGVVLLAVAENKLTWDLLKPKVEEGFANLPQVCPRGRCRRFLLSECSK
jgi:hypothetical protein